LGDQGVKVFDLALDGIRCGIAAFASPPAVIVEHGEMPFEESSERRPGRPVVECANHQDDRGTLS
jgi:hypothetical protein